MKKNLDMTEGKPISLLWAFTFPTLMGNLLNQVYSITDSIVVGRYLGQTALAAVGSTMPVILLLAALMIGINVGVGIIISRYFGQKNEELMRRAFVNSLYLGLFLSAGMMVMGLTFSGTILRWMGTPEGPLQEATAYLEISFITMICPLMYYLFSSAFRGLGDSQTALYCLIVSVLSNIGLDVLFVENIGNLVCPAEFDTGAAKNAMILSVPEGHDKPLKYPLMFQVCDVVLVNKIDVLPYFNFDLAKCTEYVRMRNPKAQVIPICAATGEGMDAWYDWLRREVRAWRGEETKKENGHE